MRSLLSICMLLATLELVACNYVPPFTRPSSNQPGFPSFPGGTPPFNPMPFPGSTGPFIPTPQSYPRFRRSAEDDQNKITVNANKEGGKSSYGIDYERKIYENKYGSIDLNAGVNKNQGSKPESHVGVSGSFSW